MAVDTLGHLLALHVTPADEQDRSQVGKLVQAVQEETCASPLWIKAIPAKLPPVVKPENTV